MPLLLSLAWRNSASRPQRSLLSVLAIALGVAMILGTYLTGSALQREIDSAGKAIVGNADAEVFAFASTGFSAQMVGIIGGLPEVGSAAPVVSKRLNGEVGGATQTFELLGIDPVAEQKLHHITLSSGSMISADDGVGVLLDDAWAGSHNLRVGSFVTLFTILGPDQYRVRGLVKDSAFLQGTYGPVVVVPLQVAQRAFRLGARVTQVSVSLHRPLNCGADAASRSCDPYAAFRADLRSAAIEEYTLSNDHDFAAAASNPFADIQPVMVFFSLLALAIGLFLIYNNLAVTVLERRREIGLLRSAGATADWIRSLFLAQAALFGIAGSALGVLLGLVVTVILIEYLKTAAGRGDLAVVIDPAAVLGAFVIGVAATLFCGVWPARRAAAMAPLEALRAQSQFVFERTRRRSTLLGGGVMVAGLALLFGSIGVASYDPTGPRLPLLVAAVGMVLLFTGSIALVPALVAPLTRVIGWPVQLLMPGETILARNALVRRSNRTALTIAGLMVSSSLVVAVSGLTSGALGSGEHWVDSLFVSDRLIVSPVHQSDLVRQDIGSMTGVAGTSPISFFSVRAGARALSMAAVSPLDYAARGRLDFVDGSRQTAFTELEEGRAVFISQRLASSRNIAVGSTLRLDTGGSVYSYRVAAVTLHTLPSPDGDETALIASSNARQDFGVEGFNILQVIPSASVPAGFDSSLKAQAQKYGMQLESVADVRAGVRKGVDSLLFLLTAVGLVGVLLGLLSVITTMLLNIRESSRELGLLRAVGLTRQQVQRLILAQANMLVLCGGLLGSALGLALVAVMVRAGSSTGFVPAYVVPWGAILLIVAVSLLGSTLAVVLPARRASGASIVEAVRFE